MKILELNIWEFYKNKAPHHKQRMLNSCFVSLLYFLSIISALHWSIRHAGYKQKYIQKLQNRTARIFTPSSYEADAGYLLQQLGS